MEDILSFQIDKAGKVARLLSCAAPVKVEQIQHHLAKQRLLSQNEEFATVTGLGPF